jgi:5,10-methylenetetrahydromethanopterin reductase
VALSNEVPVRESVALAREAQRLGFAEVWVPESGHGRSATSVAAVLAGATERIGLGIGVVNPFWRHPSLIAMEAATVDEVSGGRLRLGLGAAVWTLRAFGEDDARLARPRTAVVEAIRIVRGVLGSAQGRQGGIDGEVFPVRSTAGLDFDPFRRNIPIYVGAVNQRMLEATGAWADGAYLGAITSPGYARWAAGRVADGARSAGREPHSIDLIANVLVSVGRDAAQARRAVRSVLAYYLHRVEGVVVDEAGADPDAVADVRAAVRDHGVEAAAGRVGTQLIDVFAAAGDVDDVTERLRQYVDAGLRGVLGWHVFGPDPAVGLRLLAKEVWPHVC